MPVGSVTPSADTLGSVRTLLALGLAAVVLSGVLPPYARADGKPTFVPDPVLAARGFLDALDPARRRVASHPFGSPLRFEWEYRPGARSGLAVGDMTAEQRAAADVLWRSGLGPEGLRRIGAVLLRERLLQAALSPGARRRDSTWRDPGRYHLAVFGEPSASEPWSWRLDGHHLSIHLTYAGGRLVGASPAFLGGDPANASADGGHVARVTLAAWRAFHGALDATQRAAVYGGSRVPGDIAMQPGRARIAPPPGGLAAETLSATQQALLLKWIATYPFDALEGDPDRPRTPSDLHGVRIRVRGDPRATSAHHVEIAGPRFAAEHRDSGDHLHLVWRTASDHGGL